MRQLSDISHRKNPVTLPPTASVKQACQTMREHRVGAVLVVGENGQLLGIFTGRDAVNRVLAAGKSPSKTHLSEVMTAKPTTMPPHTTAIEALRLMWDGGFRHIPVIEGGKIVGVVSRGDFKALEHNRLEEERELWERI
jgi:CBS domain-containing protein